MNRRQFTASIGALTGATALPISGVSAAAPALSPVAQSTYAWAKLIARAQSKATPAMLARHLRLTPDAAHNLYQTLIHDGVLRAPIASAAAQATRPIESGGRFARRTETVQHRIRTAWEQLRADAEPMANQQKPALECDNSTEKDCTDARSDELLQKSPPAG